MKYSLLLVLASIALAAAEVVEFGSCYAEDDATAPNDCLVREVRIIPCPKTPCKVKRGKNVVIEFDFTPQFAAETLKNDVFWASPEGDLPWEGLKRNACDFVDCPLKKNEENFFSYNVTIDKLAPPRPYDVKWMVKQDNSDFSCCFKIGIVIKR